MKTIKFSFILAVAAIFGLASCSKGEKDNFMKSGETIENKSSADDFLSNYYSAGYQYGQNIITTNGENTYEVKEVVVDGDSRARGYVAFDEQDELLYFVDIDRGANVLTAFDVGSGEYTSHGDIDQWEDYAAYNQLDVILLIGDLNDDPIERGKRKFWGTTVVNDEVVPCMGGTKSILVQDWFLWMKNGDPRQVDNIPC